MVVANIRFYAASDFTHPAAAPYRPTAFDATLPVPGDPSDASCNATVRIHPLTLFGELSSISGAMRLSDLLPFSFCQRHL